MEELNKKKFSASPLTWVGIGFFIIALILYILSFTVSATVFFAIGFIFEICAYIFVLTDTGVNYFRKRDQRIKKRKWV